MAATPHRCLEGIVGALLPSARRDDVLGDLCERYTSPVGYVLDALQIVPVMVMSHALRQVRCVAAPRVAAERAPGQHHGAIVLINWLASSRPVLVFGGWYVLLSFVSVLNWMRGNGDGH